MTTNTKTIGFGLVGAGMIANYHALAIKALAAQHNIRLVGVLGRVPEKAQHFAEKHGLPFHTDDPATFFARPDIDIVCIVTPSGMALAHSDSLTVLLGGTIRPRRARWPKKACMGT